MRYVILAVLSGIFPIVLLAQEQIDSLQAQNQILDSLFIAETENAPGKPKVLHAEPLFIDLIRDLGARKGEKEWNVGFGMTDKGAYNQYTALVEYEFAPVNRLGLEFELPFSIYLQNGKARDSVPKTKLNSIKVASQYTFWVSDKKQTSLALGMIYEMEFNEFSRYREAQLFRNHLYNPFIVAAKRWGQNFHTLIYTGPFLHAPSSFAVLDKWAFNANIHYMISGTRNFLGLEMNQDFGRDYRKTVLRPQIRVGITDRLLVGIVSGIPLRAKDERLSSFLRIIYEPKGHVTKNYRPRCA